MKHVTADKYAFLCIFVFFSLICSDDNDNDDNDNDNQPPAAMVTPSPSIDDSVPHSQPPGDDDDGGHPEPQLSPTVMTLSHNGSTPAC